MPLASIIIPHRGQQKLLDKCVASIPKRDDVETIVIIDEEGRGAGWARNKGLEKAKGEYIIFADSDDVFYPSFNELLDILKSSTADVVFFNADSKELESEKPSWRANHLNRIFTASDLTWKEKHLRYHFTEPWCKAVRLDFLKEYSIRFGESKILNDIYFSTQIGVLAKSVSAFNEKCYCVYNHTGSTAKKKYGDEKMLDYTRETAKSNILLRKYGIKYHHSRMLRPLFYTVFHLQFNLAYQCWTILRCEGFSRSEILFYILSYPRDLAKLIFRKIQSGEI